MAKQAIKNFEHAGVAELIEVKIGDAKEIIPNLEGKFDLIFQDVGDKRLYPELLDNLINLLEPGGILLAEDSLLPIMDINVSELKNVDFNSEKLDYVKDGIESLKKFNKMITQNSYLKSTLLPIGDGLTVAIKYDK